MAELLVSFHFLQPDGTFKSWHVDELGNCSGDFPPDVFVDLHTWAKNHELNELRAWKEKIKSPLYSVAVAHVRFGWWVARYRRDFKGELRCLWGKVKQVVVRRKRNKRKDA